MSTRGKIVASVLVLLTIMFVGVSQEEPGTFCTQNPLCAASDCGETAYTDGLLCYTASDCTGQPCGFLPEPACIDSDDDGYLEGDKDQDGYIDAGEPCCTDPGGAPMPCTPGLHQNVDCQPQDPDSYPGATEVCDGLDNDCDYEPGKDADGDGINDDGSGGTDEDLTPPACELTQGVCAGASSSTRVCNGVDGWSACDYGTNYQSNETSCIDGLDNDCDGSTDYPADVDSCADYCNQFEASITAPSEALLGEEVDFSVTHNFAADATVTYSWDFGDTAGTSTEEGPAYTYSSEGTYMVALTASDSICPAQASKEINVSCGVSVEISELAYSAYPKNFNIAMIASVTSELGGEAVLTWDFGDNTAPESGFSATHAYAASGNYTAEVTAAVSVGTDESGSPIICTASDTLAMSITEGTPISVITSPIEGVIAFGTQIIFEEASIDLDGRIVEWIWDFGDKSDPWGYIGTIGNLPACFNYNNPLISCTGQQNIEWATQTFASEADCTCVNQSAHIYPQSVIESTSAPGLLLYSYGSPDACADYGDDEDRDCEVTLTVKDNMGNVDTASVTLTLSGEIEPFVCADYVDDTVSCGAGDENLAFTSGEENCCCKSGLIAGNASLVNQAAGGQIAECELPEEANKTEFETKTFVPGEPDVEPESNFVTPQSQQVDYNRESLTSQMAGRTAPRAPAPPTTPAPAPEPAAPAGLIIGIVLVALIAGLGVVYKLGKLPPTIADKISALVDKLPPQIGEKLKPMGAVPEGPPTKPVAGPSATVAPGVPPETAATADPLASYVSQARGQGMTDDQVRSVLKAQGWPDDKINAAMGG